MGKDWEDCRKKVSPADEYLVIQGKEFWKKIMRRVRLVKERNALRENKKNWICGDEEFWQDLMRRGNYLRFAARELVWNDRFPAEYKTGLLKFYKSKIAFLKKNRWRKKDLGEYYCVVMDNSTFCQYLDATLGYERERITMGVFDLLLKERKPKCIAIKFGAAHIARFRRLLEKRGFRRYRVRRLHNISFPQ